MSLRTINDPSGLNIPLVERLIGMTAYDIVKFVAMNMDDIKEVVGATEQVGADKAAVLVALAQALEAAAEAGQAKLLVQAVNNTYFEDRLNPPPVDAENNDTYWVHQNKRLFLARNVNGLGVETGVEFITEGFLENADGGNIGFDPDQDYTAGTIGAQLLAYGLSIQAAVQEAGSAGAAAEQADAKATAAGQVAEAAKSRANHTGTQAISTIDGLGNKLSSIDGAIVGVLTPDQVGAQGDGVTDDRAKFTDAMQAALTAGTALTLPPGRTYKIVGSLDIPNGLTIRGEGRVRLYNGRMNVGNNCSLIGISIDGNNKTNNDDLINISNKTKVRLLGLDLRGSQYNAITISNSIDVLIEGCVGDDIGDASAIDVTFGGMFAYVSISDKVVVRRNIISRTRGLGAVFFNDCNRVTAVQNEISDVRFRGIHSSGTTGEAILARNEITRTGEIDQTVSAVGCNGIFATGDWRKTTVKGNIISYCAENGIEGDGRFLHNTVTHCGYRTSLDSPSKTGIYLNSGVARWNSVYDAPLHGISAGPSDGSVYDINISDNEINDFGGAGILVHINGAGAIGYNVIIARNNVENGKDDATASINLATTGGAAVQNAVILGNVVPPSLSRFLPSAGATVLGNSWQLPE